MCHDQSYVRSGYVGKLKKIRAQTNQRLLREVEISHT